jgi:hypothetical protein
VSKDDVDPPVQWTIAKVEKVELDDDEGGKKSPPVLFFRDADSKPLILNNTNWMALEDLYGDESDHWIGQPVELYKDPTVMFGGKRVGGVRVRAATATAWNTALVARVAALPYFDGNQARATKALQYMAEKKQIAPTLADDAIFAIMEKAAATWAKEDAAKKAAT